jgi:hypothetical protein
LNTALANKQGELVLPVIITGSMNHPVVTPDVEKIAQMKLNNILPNAAGMLGGKNPGGVGGIVGGLLGGGQQQPAAQPGQKPNQQQDLNNSINNALGGLLGGKKKPKQ